MDNVTMKARTCISSVSFRVDWGGLGVAFYNLNVRRSMELVELVELAGWQREREREREGVEYMGI